MLNEVEAAQALGELRRERLAAGLPVLNEGQAALFLRDLGEVRSLPEAAPSRGGGRPRRSIPGPRRRMWPGRRSDERSQPTIG